MVEAVRPRAQDKRRAPRKRVRLFGAIIVDAAEPPIPCVLWDVSDQGAKLKAGRPGLLPERFTLVFSNDLRRRCEVRWRSEGFIGVEFLS